MRGKLLTVLLSILTVLCLMPVHALDTIFGITFTDPGVHEYTDGDTEYYADQGSVTAHVQAWKGDLVELKLAVHSGIAGTVEIQVSDLVSTEGTISKENAHATYLRKTQASLGTGEQVWDAPHVSIPEIITEETSFEMNGYESEYVWISVSVPKDTKAGMYTGTVSVVLDGMQEDATIELEVLKMILPQSTPLSLDLWQYPYSSLRYYEQLNGKEAFSEEHKAILKEELSTYAEMGGNAITVSAINEPWGHQTYDDYPSMIVWHKSDEGYMWYDYSRFDEWVKLCMECGIDARIDTFSLLPWDGAVTLTLDDGSEVRYPLENGSQEWADVWRGFLYDYMYHLNDMGWLEKTYIFLDEREMWQVEAAVNLIQSTTIEDKQPLKLAMAINHIPQNEPIYDNIDYVSISVAAVPENDRNFEDFLKHRRELGLETTMYNCSTTYPNTFAISDPKESVWTMLYLDSRGFDGFLRWAYDAWLEDPLNSLDFRNFEAGDTLLVYPDEANADTPHTHDSVRLRMLAQGMREVKKIHYLKQYANEASVSALMNAYGNLSRPAGNFNAWGSMTAASMQSSLAVREQATEIETLLEQASKEISDRQANDVRIIYACE